MEIAKSGRKYQSIPDGYDVEEWDEMTPIQRLRALGLIADEKPKWMDYDDGVDESRLGLDGEESWLP